MSEDFRRAINDLDHARQDPGAFQDARAAILREIHNNPTADPNRIIQEVNRVENSATQLPNGQIMQHDHFDVGLVKHNGYLDVVPLQAQGYGPGPNQGYEQPGYPQQGYGQVNPVVPFVEGAIVGGVIGSLLHNNRRPPFPIHRPGY
jgi:hypothetical protein